jgi:hypothetical protein
VAVLQGQQGAKLMNNYKDSILYKDYVESAKRHADLHMYEMMRMSSVSRLDYMLSHIEKMVSAEFINSHITNPVEFSKYKEMVALSIYEDVDNHFTTKADLFIETYKKTLT